MERICLAQYPFPELINYVFNGISKFNDIPILDTGDMNGSTDYIDYIKESHLRAPIMKGIDCFNRRFITFKLEKYSDEYLLCRGVVTLFQRYTSGDMFTCGSHTPIPRDELTFGDNYRPGKSPRVIERLRKIVAGEQVEAAEYHGNIIKLATDEMRPVLGICSYSFWGGGF